MDINELKEVLNKSIKTDTTPFSLELNSTVLPSDKIRTLTSVLGIDKGLIITSPHISEQGDSLCIKGGCSFFGMKDLSIEIILMPNGKTEDREATLKFSILQMSLKKAVSMFIGDVEVPGILPEIVFESMSVTLSSKGMFEVKGASSLTCWDWNLGAGHPFTAQIKGSLHLKREPGKNVMLVLEVSSEGDVVLVDDDLHITSLGLKLCLNKDKTWSISGNTEVGLFGEPFMLDAVYEHKTEKLTLSGSAKSGRDFGYTLEDIGEITFKGLKLILQKKKKGLALEVEGGGGIKIFNRLGIPGLEKTENLLDVDMDVGLFYDKSNYGIVLRPKNAVLSIPIPIQDQEIFFDILFGDEPQSKDGVKGSGIFLTKNELAASVKLRFRDLPEGMYALVPRDGSTATFKLTNNAAVLSIDRITAPVEIPIPPLNTSDPSTGGERTVDLGKALIDMTDLKLSLSNEIELSVLFGIGLPQLLNKIFGIKEDGSPSVDFFNTYDGTDEATREATTIKMKLCIGTNGVSATIAGQASPIKAIKLSTENNKTWVHCNLGEFGQASFQMPVLSLDAKSGSFKASGGFDVTRPLALPLTPLKALLELGGMKDISEILPKSISMYLSHQFEPSDWPHQAMPRPSLLDSQGKLDTKAIKKAFTDIADSLSVQIPDLLFQQLELLAEYFDSLPDKLREYLQFEVPKSFSFDLAVTMDGGLTFKMGVKDGDEPVKIIFPSLNGPFPVLIGIELTKVALGEILSGNFFTLEAGVCIDVFDISQIIAALVLKEASKKIQVELPVSEPGFIHSRMVIDDLYMLIDYKMVAMVSDVPIPIFIPLFFDQLGVMSTSLVGSQIRANIAFPKPELDMAAFGKVLLQMKDFFTKYESLMVPEKLNTKMDLRVILNQNFITLPKFLGGCKLAFDGMNGENSALSFNGDSRLEIKYPEKTLQAFTIELWFKRNREGAEVEFLTAGNSSETFEIHLGGASGSNTVRFIPIPGFYVDTPADCFASRQWVHLACVYDPRQMPHPARIYINGVEQKVTETGTGIRHTLKNSPFNGLFIGCRQNKQYPFQGEIADVRLWNKARSGSEIRENMSFRLLSTEENLIGNWPLLDGGGTDGEVYDLTKNSSVVKKYRTSWKQPAPFTNDRLELSALAVCAAVMNGVKRLNLNDLIRIIPLEFRIGYLHSLPSSVIPLEAEAAWMVTTPEEFKSILDGKCYEDVDASHRQSLKNKIEEFAPVHKDLLELLDAEPKTDAELNQINAAPCAQADTSWAGGEMSLSTLCSVENSRQHALDVSNSVLKDIENQLAQIEQGYSDLLSSSANSDQEKYRMEMQLQYLQRRRNYYLDTHIPSLQQSLGEYKQEQSAPINVEISPKPVVVHSQSKKANEQGLAVFLKGAASFPGLLSSGDSQTIGRNNQISVMYALSASNSGDFSTGYKLTARLKDIIDFEAFGHITVNTRQGIAGPQDIIKLIGYGHLYIPILNHKAYQGYMKYIHEILEFDGHFTLYPEGLPFQVAGAVKGYLSKDNFYFSGSVNSSLAGLQLLNSSIYLSPTHAYIEGSWLDTSLRLDIIKKQDSVGLEGKAGISLAGLNAFAHIKIDAAVPSLQIDGTISDVWIAPVFRITGVKDNEAASFTLEFSETNPVMDVQGRVELLGLSAQASIHVSKDGFFFYVYDRLFGMFDCQLEAEGLMITDPGTFHVKGTFVQGENNFCTYIQNCAASIVNSLKSSADTEFDHIRSELTKRQEELKSLDTRISNRKTELLRLREGSLRDIENLKSAIRGFQNEIDRLQNEINAKQERKNQLGREIDHLRNRPWWEQYDFPIQCGWRIAEQAAIEAEVAMIRVSQDIARVSLESVRIALSMAQAALSVVPVELDPEILTLITAKEVVTQAIEMLKLSLEGTKTIFHAGTDISEYILKNGTANILKIGSASFECKLDAIKDSKIDIKFENVEFMGSKVFGILEYRFDFSNPLKSIQELITGQLS